VKAMLEVEPKNKTHLEELTDLQKFFVLQQKPFRFDPYKEDNIVMQLESEFEKTVAVLQENGIPSPKELSEWEYYSRLEFYRERYKSQ
jgi:hypothetical protein